ncbi:MAG: hypothetical protein JJ992_06950 [Planctomycetes bacterium]|nr:hypothetical protein [Planctomycetota bacterium]
MRWAPDVVRISPPIISSGTAHERETLRELAGEVWEGGEAEIEQFLEIAIQNRPFPI